VPSSIIEDEQHHYDVIPFDELPTQRHNQTRGPAAGDYATLSSETLGQPFQYDVIAPDQSQTQCVTDIDAAGYADTVETKNHQLPYYNDESQAQYESDAEAEYVVSDD